MSFLAQQATRNEDYGPAGVAFLVGLVVGFIGRFKPAVGVLALIVGLGGGFLANRYSIDSIVRICGGLAAGTTIAWVFATVFLPDRRRR